MGALSRRLGGLQGRGIETTVAKVGLVSAGAGTAAWLLADAIGWAGGLRAVGGTVLGLLVGGAVLAAGLTLVRVEEWQALVAGFRPAARRGPGGGAGVGR
jgi:hypothetical protein